MFDSNLVQNVFFYQTGGITYISLFSGQYLKNGKKQQFPSHYQVWQRIKQTFVILANNTPIFHRSQLSSTNQALLRLTTTVAWKPTLDHYF
jgi:hypothetical protein